MAKKTVKKKELCTSETEVARLDVLIEKLNQRIDRLIDAHERCKSLKGL